MNLFECKVRYVKINTSGKEKTVNENYLVDACSFTEAEARIYAEMEVLTDAEFSVESIKKSNINEVLVQFTGDTLYKCKVTFIAFNEETGSEKKTISYLLTPADSVSSAYDNAVMSLSDTVSDYDVSGIVDSKLIDYIPYSK